MRDFAKQLEEELLTRFADWAQPVAVVLPRRIAPRRRWLPVGAAVAVALLLAGVPSLLQTGAAPLRLGPKVLRLAWPAGYNARAQLTLHDGRLVVYEGRRATEFVAGRLAARLWSVTLPRGTTVLAADAGSGGVTALVVRAPHSNLVHVQMLSQAGRSIQAPLLSTVLGRLPHPGPFTVRTMGDSEWLISDTGSTWIVMASGAPLTQLAGGSGSLAVADTLETTLFTWDPVHAVLYAYQPGGMPVGSEHVVPFLKDNGGAGGRLVPAPNYEGFAIVARGAVATVAPPSSGVASGAATLRWHAGAVVTATGLLTAARHQVTLAPAYGPDPGPLTIPTHGAGEPLGLMGPGATLITFAHGRLDALTPTGRLTAAVSGVQASTVQVGGHFAYVATPAGLVQLGPYPVRSGPRRLTWTATTRAWTVTLTVSPLPPPPTFPKAPPSPPILPGAEISGPLVPLYLNVGVGVQARGSARHQARTTGLTLGQGGWAVHFTAPTPAGRVTGSSFPLDGSPFVWEALQHGWLPVPRELSGQLHYEREGHPYSVAVHLHAVR